MVPKGWRKGRVDDLLLGLESGVSVNGEDRTLSKGEQGVLKVSAVSYGVFDPSAAKVIAPYEISRAKTSPKANQIIISRSNTEELVGASAYIEKDYLDLFLPDKLWQTIPKPDSNMKWLSYILASDSTRYRLSNLATGTSGSMKNITKGELLSLRISIPPLTEQKKIAQILSTWDKAIDTSEKLLANSCQQKKALMQQLLTGKKRLRDKNGVRFSGEWKLKKLSQICDLNPRKPAEPSDGLVSFIAMDSVSEDAKIKRQEERKYIEVNKGFTSFIDHDVIVAKITPCFENGKGAYAEGLKNSVGFGSTEFHILRAKQDISSKYIYYTTNTSEFRIRGEANMQGSAGQKRVTTDYLKGLKLSLPSSLGEQEKIAATLSSADREIETLQQKLDCLKQEKKALMQQLLTGKRRVQVEEAQ
ncbi:restriction endonuclease subunit S [uncultured Microbulbifer sp.]|uniref:restriction endonuclease subunit S n=1 Tax=uncultured Microbulbifer sp. TaxID=348147 RepID=UPI00262DB12C|nr:restriction endonuclease subunit S [uncultured Microbulbifer sp.]